MKFLKFTLFVVVLAFLIGKAHADPCIKMIEDAKRNPVFGAIGSDPGKMSFWSSSSRPGASDCYYRIKDEKTGFKKRLEKLGYEVRLADYRNLQCHEYCYAAYVEWAGMKNIGLNRKERKRVAELWLADRQENASACAWAMMQDAPWNKPSPSAAAGCRTSADKQIEFFVPCLKKTGNLYRCHSEFYKIKNK